MLPFCPNDFDDNNITKIATRAEESRQLAPSAHSEAPRQRSSTLRFQTPNGVLRSRRSRMGLYSSEKVGLSENSLRRYFGPYQVLRRLSAVTYAVQDFDPVSRKRKLREVVHVLHENRTMIPLSKSKPRIFLPKNHTKDPSLIPE
ncbi:transposon Ty3-I Gag-Pol polyprotein [Trichonephila clavipes]|nr:transposon Ty3-I Gag-Pol polyprotein [Trichonephila clavipes]